MWEVGKEYRTRKGECARFMGMLDTTNAFQTHVFAVKTRSIPAVETVRMTNAEGMYGSVDKTYRPYDIITDRPTATEKAKIDRVLAAGDRVEEVLLEILRENMT